MARSFENVAAVIGEEKAGLLREQEKRADRAAQFFVFRSDRERGGRVEEARRGLRP